MCVPELHNSPGRRNRRRLGVVGAGSFVTGSVPPLRWKGKSPSELLPIAGKRDGRYREVCDER